MKFSIAVLITCHNRKEKTLQCLHALFSQKGLIESYLIDVFLVDDGCTDGTAEVIMQDFPQVNIIQGNGELYWNRGMRLSWETAAASKDFDYYLWLNDDTFLFENALLELIDCSNISLNNSIICGITCSKITNEVTYGGYNLKHQKISPNRKLNICTLMNGNVVLVPNYCYKILGNLNKSFRHALGDFEYCLRAKKFNNINVFTSRIFVANCENNTSTLQCFNFKLPFFKRLSILYSPLGLNPFEFFIYDKFENGLIVAIKHFVTNHLKLIDFGLEK